MLSGGGVVFGQSVSSLADDDDGISPAVDAGAVNLVRLVGDVGTGSETTYDLNLGSLDIIGIGTLVSGTGELRSGAGIVFNGGNDNSRDTGLVDDVLVVQTASNDVRLNGGGAAGIGRGAGHGPGRRG